MKMSMFFFAPIFFEFLILKSSHVPIIFSIRLVFLVFDSFMNNWWGRRQYFFPVNSFLKSPYSNWPRRVFSTQSDDSFMEKYDLGIQKRGIFDRLPRRPKSKFSKKEKYIPTELSPLSEKPKSLGIGLKLVKISRPNFFADTHRQTFSDSSSTKVENRYSYKQLYYAWKTLHGGHFPNVKWRKYRQRFLHMIWGLW